MIEVPSKIWRPKVVRKYITPNLEDTSMDDLLDYGQYRNCLYKPELEQSDSSKLPDIINFNAAVHSMELERDLSFDDSVDAATRISITDIIHEFWDFFVKEGTKRPILGYESGIDTGGAKPIFCRKPSYGPYESKVTMAKIVHLMSNKWINQCGGPWGA